jgi:ArsR family transcriptional regulator
MIKKLIATIQNETCCTPANRPMVESGQIESAAQLFAALADSTRLGILNLLAQNPEEVCVCDITDSFKLGQPTISHHLKILREAGLVMGVKRGKWVHYSLIKEKYHEVQAILERVYNTIG